jgi:hypothetical protein
MRTLILNFKTPFKLIKGNFIAGGALRSFFDGTDVQDWDIFSTSIENSNEQLNSLLDEGWKVVFQCPENKLTTLKKHDVKLQLIKEMFGNPLDVIDLFDIRAGCLAFDGNRLTILNSGVIRDIKNKNIVIHRLTYPVSTFSRVIKYTKKGYKISNSEILKILKEVSEGSFNGDAWRFYID